MGGERSWVQNSLFIGQFLIGLHSRDMENAKGVCRQQVPLPKRVTWDGFRGTVALELGLEGRLGA